MTHPASTSRSSRGWTAAWVALTALVALAVWKLAPHFPELVRTLGGGHPGWLVAAVLLNFVGQPLQALAWTHFVPPGVTYRRRAFFQTSGVMAAVSNGVPVLLSGLATGVQLLATRGGLGHAGALAVVSLDQLSEGVAKVALVALVLAVAPVPGEMALATGGLAVGVVAMAAVLWFAAGKRPAPPGPEEDAPPAGGWPATALAFVGRWARSLERLRSPRRMLAGLALVLTIKVGEGAAIFAVVHALGVDAPFWGVPLALLAVNLSTMVGVTPANLGVYEGAAFGAWTLAGVDAPMALAVALAQHAAYLIAARGGGWLLTTLAAGSEGPAAGS